MSALQRTDYTCQALNKPLDVVKLQLHQQVGQNTNQNLEIKTG